MPRPTLDRQSLQQNHSHGGHRQPVFLTAMTAIAVGVLALLSVLAPLMLAAPASAQDTSAPTRLDGSGSGDSSARRPTIRVEELGAPGAGSIGTLTDGNGGLGTDLWRGSTLQEVNGLLAKLPQKNASRLLHDLQRRLLLTVALAPRGKATTGFTAARLNALSAMGATEDVLALSARTTVTHKAPFPVARAWFLKGDHKQGCQAISSVEAPVAGSFAEQAQIACHVLVGDPERAEIAIRLLHEQGSAPDKGFEQAVMAAVLGKAPARLGSPPSLSVALLRHSKAALSLGRRPKVSNGALVALSTLPGLTRTERIAAAERALKRGVAIESDLAVLYAGANLEGGALKDLSGIRLKTFDARARTRLYLAAAAADGVGKRLRILSIWWRLAEGAARQGETGAEALAARLTTPFLKNIRPSGKHQDHAAHIARAYFAVGQSKRALAWYRSLKSAPFKNPVDVHRVTAAAVIAAPAKAKDIEAWIAHKARHDPKHADGHTADLKAFLEGLGRMQAFNRLWRNQEAVADGRGRSSDHIALREAAATGKRGLTVLHILTLIDGRNLKDVRRGLLREAIAGLRAVGLGDEARQLAIEAALARRL